MKISLKHQVLEANPQGMATWYSQVRDLQIEPSRCAIVICDVWDHHWCRGAEERLSSLIPRMEQTLAAARKHGMQIIHAPSDTMEFYAGSPARDRILGTPSVTPPKDLVLSDPPLPIDDSDEGADTGETESQKVWSRQHPGISIDPNWDVISDQGLEVYRWLRYKQTDWVFIMGVHTNMCILHRTFGIKQMVRWGVNIALVRDLTDSMYNPAMAPYVPHMEGTNLVIGYIEKFWCPTTHSQYLHGL